MKENILFSKSKIFALRIIKLSTYLKEEKNEYSISKQIFRSGTSIGANIAESQYAYSKADFINKLHISLKEASETVYWLDLLYESNILHETEFKPMKEMGNELIKLLTTSIKTAKEGSRHNE